MAKFRIKTNLKALKKLQDQLKEELITKEMAKQTAEIVVDGMKRTVEGGNSPITRQRFPAYRGSYREKIAKGRIPGKSLQPVNLTLTGRFLRSLTAFSPIRRNKQGYISIVGFDPRFGDSEDKEKGHRDGANNQAKRPIIPVGSEKIHQSIISPAVEFLVESINKIISKRFR